MEDRCLINKITYKEHRIKHIVAQIILHKAEDPLLKGIFLFNLIYFIVCLFKLPEKFPRNIRIQPYLFGIIAEIIDPLYIITLPCVRHALYLYKIILLIVNILKNDGKDK